MVKPTAHIFNHVSFDGLGCIKNWLEDNFYNIKYCEYHREWQLPNLHPEDFVVIMGGAMGVSDFEAHP